jgi:hypothetical protein
MTPMVSPTLAGAVNHYETWKTLDLKTRHPHGLIRRRRGHAAGRQRGHGRKSAGEAAPMGPLEDHVGTPVIPAQ